MALHIPADFPHDLGQGLSTEVQTLVDGSFSNTAIIALNYVDAMTQTYVRRLQERTLVARGRLPKRSNAMQIVARVRYNPALRSEHYVIPGLFAVILTAFSPLLTASERAYRSVTNSRRLGSFTPSTQRNCESEEPDV